MALAAGESFELRHAGYHALNSLRIEKAYRHWGHDITDEDTSPEAGLDFAVKYDKAGGFIGREALLVQKEKDPTRRLVQFRLDDPQPMLYYNEPIWREDTIVGHITSGAYGHTLGSCIGLGYVVGAIGDEKFEIEVAGKKYSAEPSIRPLYDPDNARIRC